MKKNQRLQFAEILFAAVISVTVLSACHKKNEADWEDTLPSAVTTTSVTEVQVITEDTKPPISIEMPETTTTTASTRNTELATTAYTTDETEDDGFSSITGVPEVPVSQFTSTSASVVSIPETDDTSTTSVSDSEIHTEVSELTGGTLAGNEDGSLTGTAASGSDSDIQSILNTTGEEPASGTTDKPYVFNDPISRPYCYSTLDANERQLYDFVIKAIQRHESKITIPKTMTVTTDDYCKIYEMIYNSEHSIFYIDTQMKYTSNSKTKRLVSAELCYTFTAQQVSTMQKKIDEAAETIINRITEDMTEYDVAKLFFDTIVTNCVYDETGVNCRDIYGCLVDGKAICGGYAKAFSYLCDKVGIQTLTITGDTISEGADPIPHMWNMIKLGGEWYHIDVTAGFVKNSATPYIRYDYFCVDDSCINKNRTVYEQSYSYPAATANKYNFYTYNGLCADSWESAKELLVNKIIEASSKGETTIQIRCTNDEAFDQTVYNLFDRSQAQALTILENVYDSCEKKYNRESVTYNQDKSTGVIKIFISYLD